MNLAQELQDITIGVRLRRETLALSKSMKNGEARRAAATFGASDKRVRASKVLFNRKDEILKPILSLMNGARAHWEARTLPYTLPGVRLLRRDQVQRFDAEMKDYQEALTPLVARAHGELGRLKADACAEMGDLYCEADFPDSLLTEYQIIVEFVSVQPPVDLKQIAPDLYYRECQRITAQFELSLAAAEQGFATQLQKMLDQLAARLTPGPDGRTRIYETTASVNFLEFFQRFRELSLPGSAGALSELVTRAEQIMQGTSAADLRASSAEVRAGFAGKLTEISAALSAQVITKPARKLDLDEAA